MKVRIRFEVGPEWRNPALGNRFEDPELYKRAITGIAVRGMSIFAAAGDREGYRAVQELAASRREVATETPRAVEPADAGRD